MGIMSTINSYNPFGKKPEEPVKKKTWLGSIKAIWIGPDKQEAYYNIFVDEDGRRTVEYSGFSPLNHPLYLTRIYPWLNGAADDLIVHELATYHAPYWQSLKDKLDTSAIPAEKKAKRG